jgi:hypothetical protein
MRIILQYALKDNALDSVSDLSSSLKKNVDSYNKWNGGSINAFINQGQKNLYFDVNISSNLKDYLRPVTYSFLHNCGIPYFVRADDNYDLIEELLNNEGKALKRKFNGLLVGKHVVNKK